MRGSSQFCVTVNENITSPAPEIEGLRAESIQKASRMGWFQPLHTETPGDRCERAWRVPFPTLWEAWPSVTVCQQLKSNPLTCLPTVGCTRLCPQLSAQSSMQTSSAWGSSGGCAPEQAMGTVLERNTHPISLVANPLPWSPRELSSPRERLAQNSMSPRPVGSYSSRSEGPEKNCFLLSFWCSSMPK